MTVAMTTTSNRSGSSSLSNKNHTVTTPVVLLVSVSLLLFCELVGVVDCFYCRTTTTTTIFSPHLSLLLAQQPSFPLLSNANKNDDNNNIESMRSEDETNNTIKTTTTIIRNFRQARGLRGVYRCGNTDCLGDLVFQEDFATSPDDDESKRVLLSSERGLILDLRSPSERDEAKAQKWMSRALGGSWNVVISSSSTSSEDDYLSSYSHPRIVLRIDVLQPERFVDYSNEYWLGENNNNNMGFLQQLQTAIDGGEGLHRRRMDELNRRGLLGLNQAILESGKADLCAALKSITQFRETHGAESPVVIHCVQGKDRTGVLTMLCQSMLGVADADMVADYHESAMRLLATKSPRMETSAAAEHVARPGRLDRRLFSDAPAHVMEQTLAWIRETYGSIEHGYLDHIGFDDGWRQRFTRVVVMSSSSSSSIGQAASTTRSRL